METIKINNKHIKINEVHEDDLNLTSEALKEIILNLCDKYEDNEWEWETEVNSLKEEIRDLKETIEARDEIIDEYEEKLDYIPEVENLLDEQKQELLKVLFNKCTLEQIEKIVKTI